MMESITFDTSNQKIIVVFDNGESKEYLPSDAAEYLKDTGRESDIYAMGWNF
jgi:hypothetical protein